MVVLTRRWFVFGSAAAVAAAALPALALEAPAIIKPFTPVVAPHEFLSRRVCDLWATFDEKLLDGIAEVSMFVRGSPDPWLHIGLSTRCSFRWVPRPREELILRPQDHFALAVKSPRGVGRIHLTCYDKIDDGPSVALVEEHIFPQRGPAQIHYLNPDNSLEARLKREKEAAELAAREVEEDDYDDDYDDDDEYSAV
jgi:hypothetical protein